MLDDLGQNVDRTDTKLSGAMKKMQKVIRATEGQFRRTILHSPDRLAAANETDCVDRFRLPVVYYHSDYYFIGAFAGRCTVIGLAIELDLSERGSIRRKSGFCIHLLR